MSHKNGGGWWDTRFLDHFWPSRLSKTVWQNFGKWKIHFLKYVTGRGILPATFLGHLLQLHGKRRRRNAHIKSLLVESPDTEGSVCRKMQEKPGVGGTREELVVHYKHACIFSSMKPVYTVVNIFGLNALRPAHMNSRCWRIWESSWGGPAWREIIFQNIGHVI